MKKAQSQIITTVLIILLVLAAIVIVWQVVNTTVTGGSDEVEAQAACIGLSIDLTADTTAGTVALKPNQKIDGFRVYVNGALETIAGSETQVIEAYETNTATVTIASTDKVTSAGKLGTQWCEGLTEVTA
jgi:hypothetical protein